MLFPEMHCESFMGGRESVHEKPKLWWWELKDTMNAAERERSRIYEEYTLRWDGGKGAEPRPSRLICHSL